MASTATQAPKDVVILGGGIAGVMTAYFLTESASLPQGVKITIVENTNIAAGASGYSGGFLAKDWHGSATASLAAMSYDLHAKLAKEFGGEKEWGYRTVDTLSIETDDTAKKGGKAPLPWLTSNVVNSRSLGTKTTTAQVHPKLFTQYFFQKFSSTTKAQACLVKGQATAIKGVQDGGRVTSVQVKVKGEDEERSIPADAVVIAVGPWTGKVAKELLGNKIGSRLGVEGHRAHSIVVKTKEELSAHCLFTSMTMKDGSMGEPEVYARPDGTTYICGAGDNEPLPETAADVRPSPSAIQKLRTQAHAISPVFTPGNADVQAEQACFLPIADRGRPLIGKVKGAEGVYVASGLSCWGITQGPGTGLCMAQLILEGKASAADISRLAP